MTLGNQRWEVLSTTGVAPKTLSHTANLVGATVYVIGGIYNSEATNDVFMLHLHSLTWTPLRTSGIIPQPRSGYRKTKSHPDVFFHINKIKFKKTIIKN